MDSDADGREKVGISRTTIPRNAAREETAVNYDDVLLGAKKVPSTDFRLVHFRPRFFLVAMTMATFHVPKAAGDDDDVDSSLRPRDRNALDYLVDHRDATMKSEAAKATVDAVCLVVSSPHRRRGSANPIGAHPTRILRRFADVVVDESPLANPRRDERPSRNRRNDRHRYRRHCHLLVRQ